MSDTMITPGSLKGRYQIREVLGQGAMGVVYLAQDTVLKRDVTLKTIRDFQNQAALELFRKECAVLASITHPNIVEIYDIGEIEVDAGISPYFVMPCLRGATLDKLIRTSRCLPVERTADIIAQTCRGLQAAHDHGLIHRDLKPSNLFVLEDDSVKIIDFGVAHLADQHSTIGIKGTLCYMAPEQLLMKGCSAQSDIFSVAVVCYEALTGRLPFHGATEGEVVHAIIYQNPPLAAEINPAVGQTVSQVVHKAMAKQPVNRFQSAREFADTLLKAVRGEPIEVFDPSRLQPRVETAQRALQTGEIDFAAEIIAELEAEGQVHPDLAPLRRQVDEALRTKTVTSLLDSVHRRLQEQEFQLALNKVQEVLNLDPANPEAMSLRTAIEEKRNSKKISDLLSQARQEMSRGSYARARQTAQAVLQLRQDDEGARQLLSEVDRGEQEALRICREVDDLREKALAARQTGDLDTAVQQIEQALELERTVPDTVLQDRRAVHEKLHEQLREELGALERAYRAAREHLTANDWNRALAICTDQLARYPGHTLFSALRFEVEERRQQEVAAYVSAIRAELDEEPDLVRRIEIINRAIKSHPDEIELKQIWDELRSLRRQIVSVVAQAREREDREQYKEALDLWEVVRATYPQYPGLGAEVDRLLQLQDQQVRSLAMARWDEEVHRALDLQEYDEAIDLCRRAQAEFPSDAHLASLEQAAQDGARRMQQVHQLLSQGESLCGAGEMQQGLEVMRQALRLDSQNAAVRARLLAALVQAGGSLTSAEWRTAEALAAEAMDLEPGNESARGLWTRAQEFKQNEQVEECLAQAHERYKAADLEGALARVEEGLVAYPNDGRLQRIQARLRKALQLTGQGPEIQRLAPETPQPVPAVTAAPHPPAAERKAPAALYRRWWLAGAVVALSAVLALAVVLLVRRSARDKAASEPARFPLTIRTEPPGAAVVIDGTIQQQPGVATKLSAGAHQATASLNGYETATERFEIARGGPSGPITITLRPVSQTLHLSTDIEGLNVLFDQQLVSDVTGGQLTLDNIAPGPHELAVSGRYGTKATLKFQSAPGAMPELTDGIKAENLKAVVVSSSGTNAHVYANFGPGKVTLSVDGGDAQSLDENGLDLNGLAPGNRLLTFFDGKQKRELQVEIGATSALAVLLTSDRNVGSLVIDAGEDDVRVLIDGKERRAFRQRGQLIFSNLDVKAHVVRVVKDGYRAEPDQQTVTILKGELSRLRFNLRPISTLVVRGAPPGCELAIDGRPAGQVAGDGSFSAEVEPGTHTLVLSRRGYRPVSILRQFKQGEPVQLTGPEIAMEKLPAMGTLVLVVTPPTARFTVQRSDGTNMPAAERMELPEGQYIVRASAAGYSDGTRTASVRAGRSETVELKLTSTQGEAGDMSGWDQADAWKRADNHWLVRRGGDFVTYRATQGGGRFTFSVRSSKGNPRWFVNYRDRNNYLRYEVDKTYLSRVSVVDGRERTPARVPHKINIRNGIYTVQIELAPKRAIVSLQSGSSWKRIDELNTDAGDLTVGRVGLMIPGNTQYFLANFRFVP